MDAGEISEGRARVIKTNDAPVTGKAGKNHAYAPVSAGMTHEGPNTFIYRGDTDRRITITLSYIKDEGVVNHLNIPLRLDTKTASLVRHSCVRTPAANNFRSRWWRKI